MHWYIIAMFEFPSTGFKTLKKKQNDKTKPLISLIAEEFKLKILSGAQGA